MVSRQSLLGCLIFALLCSTSVFAQEKSAFEKRVDDWTSVKAQIVETKSNFQLETDSDKQVELRDKYIELLSNANLIVDDLREMSLAAFQADGNDRNAAKIMMGIAVQDVNNGEERQVLELGDTLISAGINPIYFETAANSDRLKIEGREVFEELVIRQKEAAADDLPRVAFETSKGKVVLELFENEAPETVGNFVSLVKKGYYNGLKFHRVIGGFMAQSGDPLGTGKGGPGYNIFCECTSPESRRHFTGSLSMANKYPEVNTGGSQFFLAMQRTKGLDGKHTVFGRVISGMDIVEALTHTATTNPVTGADDPIPGAVPDTIKSAEVLRDRGHEYTANKVPEAEEEKDEPVTDAPGDGEDK